MGRLFIRAISTRKKIFFFPFFFICFYKRFVGVMDSGYRNRQSRIFCEKIGNECFMLSRNFPVSDETVTVEKL